MSNLDAGRAGHRQALEVLRDTLAAAIDTAVQRGDGTLAQLAAQYRATIAELDKLNDTDTKPSASARFAARVAAANPVI